jgi:hypothetical protein
MALELRIEIAIVDTEPDIVSHKGIAVRAARTVPLVSETQGMGGICEIASSIVERESDEVRNEVKDALQIIAKQPGI